MPRLTFSDAKHSILAFDAETLSFERRPEGLLLHAHGAITAQDNPAVEEAVNVPRALRVQLENEGETALDGQFTVSFLTLEAGEVAVLLA